MQLLSAKKSVDYRMLSPMDANSAVQSGMRPISWLVELPKVMLAIGQPLRD